MIVTMVRSHTTLKTRRHAMARYPLRVLHLHLHLQIPKLARKHHSRFTGFAQERRRSWFWDMRPFPWTVQAFAPTRSKCTFVVKKRHAVLDQIAFKSA